MASIVIAGDTSGTCTISAPAVAGTPTLTLPTTSGTVLTSASSIAKSQLPTGSVLQVVQTNLTTNFTTGMSGDFVWVNITGLSLSITPTSSTSKILVSAVVQNGTNNGGTWMFRIARNGTGIGVGTSTSSLAASVGTWTYGTYPAAMMVPCTWQVLDSPATTSAISYQVQLSGDMNTYTCYINRRETDTRFSCVSSITAMEIAA